MRSGFCCPTILILCITASIPTMGQERVETRACALKGNQFNCDRHAFAQVLNAARSVSVKAPGLDPTSLRQMNKLAQALGKTDRPGSDLVLVLARSGSTGIYYGPSDRELATIRAYYGTPQKLLWVESYYGQPDTAWPIVVNRLTQQFRDDFRR